MDSIEAHIKKDEDILDDPTISPQMRRHTEEELKDLQNYHQDHPGDPHDPTALELYCYNNPDAPECRFYDD